MEDPPADVLQRERASVWRLEDGGGVMTVKCIRCGNEFEMDWSGEEVCRDCIRIEVEDSIAAGGGDLS